MTRKARWTETLSAYLDGQLDDEQRTALEVALAADPALQRQLVALRQTSALVQQLPLRETPRHFLLTPTMVAAPQPKTPEPRKTNIAWLRLATALSAAAFVMMLGLQLSPNWLDLSATKQQPDLAVTQEIAGAESPNSKQAESTADGSEAPAMLLATAPVEAEMEAKIAPEFAPQPTPEPAVGEVLVESAAPPEDAFRAVGAGSMPQPTATPLLENFYAAPADSVLCAENGDICAIPGGLTTTAESLAAMQDPAAEALLLAPDANSAPTETPQSVVDSTWSDTSATQPPHNTKPWAWLAALFGIATLGLGGVTWRLARRR